MGQQSGVRPEFHVGTDYDVSADVGSLANLRGGVDDGGGMNAGLGRRAAGKRGQERGKKRGKDS